MSIRDYSVKFEKYLSLCNNANSTIDQYLSILQCFLKYFYKQPVSISHEMIADYLLSLKSTRYKRQTWYTLNKFYTHILNDPGRLASIPIPKQEKYIPETLNHAEVMRIINAIDNVKQRAAITLIYACGLRISECTNLRLSDIDGVRNQIHIKQSKGAKDRIIPIPEHTINLLRNYYQQYKPVNYLFNGQFQTDPYTTRSIQQVFGRAKINAGIIKHVTVHSLRHSRATELLRNGMDASLIQKFLGHANIKTTNEFYLHTNITDMQQAITRADFFLFNQQKQIAA